MLKLSEQLKFSKGVAQGYKWLGIAKFNLGNYFDAIQNYEKAQAVFDSIGDRRGVANMYSNIGNVYYNQGEDSKALEYFLQSPRSRKRSTTPADHDRADQHRCRVRKQVHHLSSGTEIP